MKEIKLTQGKTALVDDDDFDYLSQWTWFAHKQRIGTYYANRSIKNGKVISMHRSLLKTPDGYDTDHIDGNGLNNQRCNLRICTRSQNCMNRKSKVKYKGVILQDGKYFRARISYNKKKIQIGYFKTAELAAIAYNNKAKELYGDFAYLNINIPDPETNYNMNFEDEK